ncbi:hypothetical protein Ct61P_15492 [Colletotrichum tofieldiae]|nr:hypothetical protein Ct61P_15492 [Colletotrichum tofieldiae]
MLSFHGRNLFTTAAGMACIACIFMFVRTPTIAPGLEATSTAPAVAISEPATGEVPSTVKICNAFRALYAMHPDSPSLVLTPLELLDLSVSDPRLRHAGRADSALAGSPANRLVQQTALEAGERVRKRMLARTQSGDPAALRAMRATYVVGDMLLDDAARISFLNNLQPALGENGVVPLAKRLQAVETFCRRAWQIRGWKRARF